MPDPARFYHLGLTGHPLLQSRSPGLHAAALQAAGLRGEYRLYPIPPLPEGAAALRALLNRARSGEIDGLNVTIPHKQSVVPLLDELTPTARAVGAVNTIAARDGRLIGENTDAPGFRLDLDRFMTQNRREQPGQALVLGAGGAARAVVYALHASGWQVSVAARRMEQAGALAQDLAASGIENPIRVLELSPEGLQSAGVADLVVNATPLGMLPHPDTCPWPAGLALPPGAAVYDLVYKPPETALLRLAREARRPAANGLGMLVEQAALAFALWTGAPANRDAMRKAVE